MLMDNPCTRALQLTSETNKLRLLRPILALVRIRRAFRSKQTKSSGYVITGFTFKNCLIFFYFRDNTIDHKV